MDRTELERLAKNVYRDGGCALVGERIIAQAREISKTRVVRATTSHRMQESVLRRNVMCVIDRPFQLAQEPFQLSR
jgi:hypothetical protein